MTNQKIYIIYNLIPVRYKIYFLYIGSRYGNKIIYIDRKTVRNVNVLFTLILILFFFYINIYIQYMHTLLYPKFKEQRTNNLFIIIILIYNI